MKQIFLTPLFILILLLAACDTGPNSGRGFSLPEGNVDKGRATIDELKCNACHSVGDIERLTGSEGHDIDIRLGGQTTVINTYGDFVTSLITALALTAASNLFIDPPEGHVVPLKWQLGIGVFLFLAVAVVLIGLFRDFNKTPVPHVELDEVAEEAAQLKKVNLPDEILSGNPPKPKD